MKIKCGSCGTIFEDDVLICPGCGARFAPRKANSNATSAPRDTAQSRSQSPADPIRPAAPQPAQTSNGARSISDFDVAGSIGFSLDDEPVDLPQVTKKSPSVASATRVRETEHSKPAADNSLERSATTFIPRERKRKVKVGAWVLVLATILVLTAGIVAGVYFLVPMIKSADSRKEVMTELVGTWVSDEFTYANKEETALVETIEFTADGEFVQKYYAIDSAVTADGWKNGKWKTTFELTGTYKTISEENRIVLLCTENGQKVYYDFYFVTHDFDVGNMTLREYYNDDHTSYYDLNFKKDI